MLESLGVQYIPTKIYANKSGNSTRPYDTVVPLAKKLGLQIEEFERDTKNKIEDFVYNKLLKSEHNIILISSSHKVIPIISKLLGHEVSVKGKAGFDKLFIWKNGEFYKEYKQTEFIGKNIEERIMKFKG